METSQGFMPVACNRWDCPHCGKLRRWHLANRVRDGFAGLSYVTAITLTQKAGSSQDIVKNFYKFRRYYLRKYGINMRYFWVKEFTPESREYIDNHGNIRQSAGGERHMHILTDIYIDQKELSQVWYDITGDSYIVWINRRHIKNAAGYAMKYLTKAFDVAPYEKKERRYGFSRHREFSVSYSKNKEILPILGDFWTIIGSNRNKCRDGTFMLEYHAGDYDTGFSGISLSNRQGESTAIEQIEG